MPKVAVVGLGAMGSRIAQRLLDSGHEVLVWNRDTTKTGALTDAGARAVENPVDAAHGATAVITMLSNPEARGQRDPRGCDRRARRGAGPW